MDGGTKSKVAVDEVEDSKTVRHQVTDSVNWFNGPSWDSEEAATADAHHITSVLSALSCSRFEHIELEILSD